MSNTAPVESPATGQNGKEAFDLLMELKMVALLLQSMDESSSIPDEIDIHRWCDLGSLIWRLTDQPADDCAVRGSVTRRRPKAAGQSRFDDSA